MTTAPTNEMLALADELDTHIRDIAEYHNEFGYWPEAGCMYLGEAVAKNASVVLAALRLAATPARDVREALDELLRCANAIVGADPCDPESAEAFTMFDQARVKARRCLALSNLDAAAPAAGGDKPDAWVVQLKYGPDHWSGDMLTDVLPSDTETYRIIRQLYAAPPLQAPADSDAVREALAEAHKSFETIRLTLINNLDEPERSAFWEAVKARDSMRNALNATAAKAPAVSESDVGRILHADVDKIVTDLIRANYSDKPRLALAIGRAIVKANERGIQSADDARSGTVLLLKQVMQTRAVDYVEAQFPGWHNRASATLSRETKLVPSDPPLQAPAHSDAVREALEAISRTTFSGSEMGDEYMRGNRDAHETCARIAKSALTAPAAKAHTPSSSAETDG